MFVGGGGGGGGGRLVTCDLYTSLQLPPACKLHEERSRTLMEPSRTTEQQLRLQVDTAREQ